MLRLFVIMCKYVFVQYIDRPYHFAYIPVPYNSCKRQTDGKSNISIEFSKS